MHSTQFLIDFDKYLYPIFWNLHVWMPVHFPIARIEQFRFDHCNRMGFHHNFTFPSLDVSQIQVEAFVNSIQRLRILSDFGYKIPKYCLDNSPIGFCQESQLIRRFNGRTTRLCKIGYRDLNSIQKISRVLHLNYQQPCCVSMVCLYISVIEYVELYQSGLDNYYQKILEKLEIFLEVCLFLDYKYQLGEYINA